MKTRVEPTGRMEWVEKNAGSDLRQASTSLSEMETVQGSSETITYRRRIWR